MYDALWPHDSQLKTSFHSNWLFQFWIFFSFHSRFTRWEKRTRWKKGYFKFRMTTEHFWPNFFKIIILDERSMKHRPACLEKKESSKLNVRHSEMTKNDQNFQDNLICIYWMRLKEDRTRAMERDRMRICDRIYSPISINIISRTHKTGLSLNVFFTLILFLSFFEWCWLLSSPLIDYKWWLKSEL